MTEKEEHSQAVGVYQEGGAWQLAMVKSQRNQTQITSTTSLSDVNRLYTALQELSKTAKHPCVVSALPTQDVLVRSLTVPLGCAKEVDEVLAFQLEPILPFPVDEAVFDRYHLKHGDNSTELSILATQKSQLNSHLEVLQGQSVESEIVSTVPSALAAFADSYCPTEPPLTIVHLGSNEICCVLAQGAKVLACHRVTQGTGSYIDASLWCEEVEVELEPLRSQLVLAILALNKQFKGAVADEILLCGPGTKNPQLVSFLLSKIRRPAATCETPESDTPYLELAVPIGLALSAMKKEDAQINFRQEEFSYPRPWKRIQTPLLAYFALCLGVSAALFLAGQAQIRHSEAAVKQEYLALLATLHKTPESVEQDYFAASTGSKLDADLDHFSIEALSTGEIRDRADFLEDSLSETHEGFPLQPNLPAVSDVLAWLSSHPKVVMDTGANPKALISIEHFSYQMLKRPEKNRKTERYQVKVEMEFSTDNPTLAREFHDALIEANAIIDPKAEVKWSTNRGRYKTSFYLKDRTNYSRSYGGGSDV